MKGGGDSSRSHSAVDVEDLLHERLDSGRVDFEQDERVFLVEVANVGELVQQTREDATCC